MKQNSTCQLIVLLVLIFLGHSSGETRRALSHTHDSQMLFSLARDLWAPAELRFMGYVPARQDWTEDQKRVRQSCLYLEAATALAPDEILSWQDLVALYTSPAIDDAGRATDTVMALGTLDRFNGYPIDLWLGYRLEQFDDREDRELFLQNILPALGNYKSSSSDISTQLGLFALEKGDFETANQLFVRAYSFNPHNDEAIGHLGTLVLPPEDTADNDLEIIQKERERKNTLTILRWRTRLYNNPYDLEAFLALIRHLDDFGAYEMAQGYYQAAYDLINLAPNPDKTLLLALKLKHIVSSYSARAFRKCLEICQDVLADQPNHLTALTLSVKASEQLGISMPDIASLDTAIQSALEDFQADSALLKTTLQRAVWVYCFVVPDAVKAQDLARQFDNAANQSRESQALLAFALTLDQQTDEAMAILNRLDPIEPIAALALARSYINQDLSEQARDVLYGIDYQQIHNGLITEEIDELLNLTQPATDTDASNVVSDDATQTSSPLEKQRLATHTLKQNLAVFTGEELAFPHTKEAIVRCTMRIDKHSDIANYGDPLLVQIYLSNVSKTNLFLGPGNYIDPHLLIYADIKPLKTSVPRDKVHNKPLNTKRMFLLAHRYLGQQRILVTGQSNVIAESLHIGRIRDVLELHPQCSYRVDLQSCLDPVSDGQGGFKGKIDTIAPEPLRIIRKGFVPNRANMKRQFDIVREGTIKQQLRAINLFAGLIREAYMAQDGQIQYPIRTVDTNFLLDMLVEQLTHEDFRVRAWTAHALSLLPEHYGRRIAGPLTRCLNDTHWFVQFMASETLQTLTDMDDFNQWAAVHGDHELIKRQAQWQLDQTWESKEPPALQRPQTESGSDETVSKSGGN